MRIVHLLNGMCMALAIMIFNSFFGIYHWLNPIMFVLVGMCCTVLLFGCDELWRLTIAAMAPQSFSRFFWMTKIPFWFYAGGIGYEGGILLSKKFGLMEFYDIPVLPIFRLGGFLCVGTAMLTQFLMTRHFSKS